VGKDGDISSRRFTRETSAQSRGRELVVVLPVHFLWGRISLRHAWAKNPRFAAIKMGREVTR